MNANRLIGACAVRRLIPVFAAVSALGVFSFLAAPTLFAQNYPSPRLEVLTPPGGTAGSKIEIEVKGDDLDDAKSLYFSHPALTARRLPEPEPKIDPKTKKKIVVPERIRFEVTIPPNAPLGIHDVRVIGEWGISNPRAFVVGDLPEIAEKEKNDRVAEAQPVEINTLVNGTVINKTDVDYFSFPGKKGQKVVIHCAASSIDSRLMAYLQLYTSAGREIGSNKNYRDRDAVLSVALPDDGVYTLRLCEFAYQNGGPESFYRLTITDGPWIDAVYPAAVQAGKDASVSLFGKNLPGGEPDPMAKGLEKLQVKLTPPPAAQPALVFPGRLLPRLASVDGFSHRVKGAAGQSNAAFLTIADDPLILDNEKNNTPETAQRITLPCALCGHVEKRGDRDYYAFDAKKGEIIVIETFGDRLRSPVDMFFQLRHVEKDRIIGVYDEHSDMPARVDRFFTYTDDAQTKVVIPEDGVYELMVRSRTAEFRSGPRLVYRLDVRKPRPDFRLVLVGNHESSAGLTLRQGSSHDLNVVCFRQDEFDGEVTLTVEGLPAGVTCEPQVIGPKLQKTVLVLTASAGAADWAGEIKIKGKALIDGKDVVREGRAGCLVYPTQNANIPAVSRLCRSICLAVRDKGPFRLDTTIKEASVPVGGPTSFKIKLAKQMPDYKDNASVIAVAGPAQANGNVINFAKLTLGPDKDGEVKVTIPTNTTPGTYNLVFRGTGKLIKVDAKKKKTNFTFTAVTSPIRLTVFNSVANLKAPDRFSIKPDSDSTLVIAVERLHGYKGEFKLELVSPSAAAGFKAADITIPAGANEGRLIVKTVKGAKPAVFSNVVVRATAKIDKVTLKEETKLQVVISKDAAGGAAQVDLKAVKLLPEGAAGWRFLPAKDVKGDAWRNADFEDSKWRAAKTPLGNGEEEIKSRGGVEVPEKGESLFCRTAFEIAPDVLATKGASFQLLVASDNSATVFINGKLADDEQTDHEFAYWNREVSVPPSLLRPGRNVIAVQVHNSSGSSDAYLDLSVVAQVPK